MTPREAEYVVAHRHEYDDATYHYAIDVLESADRQGRSE